MTTNQTPLQNLKPLVVTPIPKKGESVLGFILRTAAANGYRSGNKILRYAGMTDNEARSARPPLAKLARLYGQTAEELKLHGLDDASKKYSGRNVPLQGHQIHSIFTRCKQAGICVECVREYGYIEAFQEIKYAVACPKHRMKTLYQCPTCKQNLNWLRPDLARCRCGEDFLFSQTESMTDECVLALLEVIKTKLANQPLDEITLEKHGFPVRALRDVSLNTLLSIIYRFGLFNNSENETNADLAAVETTAKVFSDWPNKFYDYLEEVHAPSANLKFNGLRGQFNQFYESFFKNIPQDQELRFMRDAFINFGQERWKLAAIHPSFIPNGTAKVLGINALSKKINKHPRTVKKLIKMGVIKVLPNQQGKTRNLFDLAENGQSGVC